MLNSGRGVKNKTTIKSGREKRSLSHAIINSLWSLRDFFVKASLVARVKAEMSAKMTQMFSIHGFYSESSGIGNPNPDLEIPKRSLSLDEIGVG